VTVLHRIYSDSDSYFNPQALVSGKNKYLGIFFLPETSACASISICTFPLFHTKVKIRNSKMSKQKDN
jgi:hypothetical protein